ncbi:cytochrome P450 [Acrocarpospora macrocephala]|uniref:Cytochrome P450 n=1 Tax=Acrocarpospora macrocephala TaxID=150177 RepID=A0A5M3WRP5_9ACTN|nr:cytochrome P450 [Acrocarpospora macrocephala]GES11176.1 cytochrome P450 [Acrocarpospora macrocephala]
MSAFDGFDLYDPGYLADPESIWKPMRDRCPVAHTDSRGGAWMLSRHGDICAVALDPETFSSRAGEVTGPVPAPGRELKIPPVSSDPPDHARDRKLLMPLFSKEAVAGLEPLTRRTARELVASIVTSGGTVDAVEEYARVIPVVVTTKMLDLPPADEALFRQWTLRMLKDGAQDYAIRAEAVRAIQGYFRDRLRSSASGGVMGHLLRKRAEGEPLSDERIVGMCFLMLIAGIDTTWSALGSALWHLATHAEHRRLLARGPELIPNAVEEFLRVYAPVTIGRVVTRDATLGGRTLRTGDRVVLPWAAANLDPAVHPASGEVHITAERPRHLAFGLGIHRCLGAQLAQMELRVALEEWLTRIPEFDLVSPEVSWSGGNTRGPESLLVRIPSSAAVR